MDVSDGLLTDLEKLCAASACAAALDIDALPASKALNALFTADERLRFQLAGGDDYELVFTAPAAAAAELGRTTGLAVTRIGEITAGSGVQCMRGGRPYTLDVRGYDHFGGESAR